MQKLGWGHFSTVWLARDFKYGTYVAIKVQKSASHYLDAAYDEVELLQKAAKMSTSKEWKDRLQSIYGVNYHNIERFETPVQQRRLPCSSII
jgi:serine/threonine-protein kinase SRPK3